VANPTIPTKKAWGLIFLSVALINGTALLGLSYYRYSQVQQRTDSAYHIVALVQTTAQRDLLKAGHLAELLGLSVDEPTNLFSFNSNEAEEKLKSTVAIKEAKVKKIRPGTIHVDLELREPVALIGNFANTAFDATGTLFPLKPYFTPKKIPVVYFEEAQLPSSSRPPWGSSLMGKNSELAYLLLTNIPRILGDATHLISVDLSKAAAPVLGQRQIIVILEEGEEKIVEQNPEFWKNKRILRLTPENWEHQLHNYVRLRTYHPKALFQEDRSRFRVVDLRLNNLAFI